MRLSVVVSAAVLLGAVLGVGLAYWEFGGLSAVIASTVPPAAAADGSQPVAEAEAPAYNFGVMEVGSTLSHSFTIHNKGQAPLKLNKGNTTCKCTLSHLEDSQIAPGASGSVTLEWQGKGEIGPFRQTADILTNDPIHPKLALSVEGELTEAVLIEPTEVVFSSLSARDPNQATFRVYALHTDHLEITEHHFESEQGSKQFDVAITPLDADELKTHRAKSGVLATLTSKPILPLGPIRQKIVLDTNLPNRPELEVAVSGTVVSDISVYGSDFSTSNSMLRLGLVKSKEGAERTLRIVTRGPHAKDIKFTVAKKYPEFLDVKLGEMTELKQGQVTQVPVTITVPAGSPPANHLGTVLGKIGEVVLETNHPDLKEVPIKVYFAVED